MISIQDSPVEFEVSIGRSSARPLTTVVILLEEKTMGH